MGKSGETRGAAWRSVLEHKSGNISETRKDGGKLKSYYGTHQRSFEATIPEPYGLLVPKIEGSQPNPKNGLQI